MNSELISCATVLSAAATGSLAAGTVRRLVVVHIVFFRLTVGGFPSCGRTEEAPATGHSFADSSSVGVYNRCCFL